MFRNYLAVALRNMVRNRLYAAINIIGLAVGLTAVLLIALFVRDEVSYDRWIPGHERTYAITQIRPGMFDTPIQGIGSFFDFRGLALALPSVETVARISASTSGLRHGEAEANEDVWWAEPDLFRVLPLPVFAGDPVAALERADGMVVTRSVARKYFGRDDVLGETIEINHRFSMTILAVLEDVPSNTHFQPHTILSGRSSFSRFQKTDYYIKYDATYYVRLKPGYSDHKFREDFDAYIARQTDPEILGPPGYPVRTVPVRLADIHFSAVRAPPFEAKPQDTKATVAAAATIGLLTLLVAGINFVNLMTAWAARRAPEVGVRKVSGAARRHLVIQFIGEALLYVIFSTVAAVAMAWLLAPQLQVFLQRREMLPYLHEPVFISGIVVFAVFLAILAGAYPAFVLSAFRPARVLKAGAMLGAGSAMLRRVLTTLQFAVLIGLMLSAVTVHRQIHFAFNDALRIPTDQILQVRTSCRDAFKDEVRALRGVREAVCSSYRGLTTGTFIGSPLILRDGSTTRTAKTSVGPGFFDFYGVKPLAGRLLPERSGDEMPYVADPKGRGQPAVMVINEAGVRAYGFENAAAAIGQVVTIPADDKKYQAEIVGVVPDFNLDSVGKPIQANYFYADPSFYDGLNVKLTGQNIPETVADIDRLWKQFGEPKPIIRSFLNQQLEDLYRDVTRQEQVFTALTCVAVFIACLGLFGLSAFTAELRTKEIGVRKAMGAGKGDILRMLVWEFAKPVLWANAIAWPVGYAVMHRWLEGFARHVDLAPWMFMVASGAALAIAVLVVIGHALSIARAEPVAALRYE